MFSSTRPVNDRMAPLAGNHSKGAETVPLTPEDIDVVLDDGNESGIVVAVEGGEKGNSSITPLDAAAQVTGALASKGKERVRELSAVQDDAGSSRHDDEHSSAVEVVGERESDGTQAVDEVEVEKSSEKKNGRLDGQRSDVNGPEICNENCENNECRKDHRILEKSESSVVRQAPLPAGNAVASSSSATTASSPRTPAAQNRSNPSRRSSRRASRNAARSDPMALELKDLLDNHVLSPGQLLFLRSSTVDANNEPVVSIAEIMGDFWLSPREINEKVPSVYDWAAKFRAKTNGERYESVNEGALWQRVHVCPAARAVNSGSFDGMAADWRSWPTLAALRDQFWSASHPARNIIDGDISSAGHERVPKIVPAVVATVTAVSTIEAISKDIGGVEAKKGRRFSVDKEQVPGAATDDIEGGNSAVIGNSDEVVCSEHDQMTEAAGEANECVLRNAIAEIDEETQTRTKPPSVEVEEKKSPAADQLYEGKEAENENKGEEQREDVNSNDKGGEEAAGVELEVDEATTEEMVPEEDVEKTKSVISPRKQSVPFAESRKRKAQTSIYDFSEGPPPQEPGQEADAAPPAVHAFKRPRSKISNDMIASGWTQKKASKPKQITLVESLEHHREQQIIVENFPPPPSPEKDIHVEDVTIDMHNAPVDLMEKKRRHLSHAVFGDAASSGPGPTLQLDDGSALPQFTSKKKARKTGKLSLICSSVTPSVETSEMIVPKISGLSREDVPFIEKNNPRNLLEDVDSEDDRREAKVKKITASSDVHRDDNSSLTMGSSSRAAFRSAAPSNSSVASHPQPGHSRMTDLFPGSSSGSRALPEAQNNPFAVAAKVSDDAYQATVPSSNASLSSNFRGTSSRTGERSRQVVPSASSRKGSSDKGAKLPLVSIPETQCVDSPPPLSPSSPTRHKEEEEAATSNEHEVIIVSIENEEEQCDVKSETDNKTLEDSAATKQEVVLDQPSEAPSLPLTLIPTPSSPIILTSGASRDQLNHINFACRKVVGSGRLIVDENWQSGVTHLVVRELEPESSPSAATAGTGAVSYQNSRSSSVRARQSQEMTNAVCNESLPLSRTRRTVKYLCAMLSCKWIVAHTWVQASWAAKRWVDPSPYQCIGVASSVPTSALPPFSSKAYLFAKQEYDSLKARAHSLFNARSGCSQLLSAFRIFALDGRSSAADSSAVDLKVPLALSATADRQQNPDPPNNDEDNKANVFRSPIDIMPPRAQLNALATAAGATVVAGSEPPAPPSNLGEIRAAKQNPLVILADRRHFDVKELRAIFERTATRPVSYHWLLDSAARLEVLDLDDYYLVSMQELTAAAVHDDDSDSVDLLDAESQHSHGY